MNLQSIIIATLIAISARAEVLRGKVLQAVMQTQALISTDDGVVYLRDWPHARFAIDGERVSVEVAADGFKEYVTVLGARSRVKAYRALDADELRENQAQANLRRSLEYEQINKAAAAERATRAAAISNYQAVLESKRLATVARVVAFQKVNANNGSPSFQIELGKRYMRGDGVETNLALARHWLLSACTNRESEATNLLRQINLLGASK